MTGINNSTLVYGVLDLIKREMDLRENSSSIYKNDVGVDPLSGTPSVFLEREHPVDSDVLTGVTMAYPSGWFAYIQLILGMSDDEMEYALNKNKYSEGELPVADSDTLSDWERLSPEEQAAKDGQTNDPNIGGDSDGNTYDPSTLPVLPEDVKDASHPDYLFYKNWRLNKLVVTLTDSSGTVQDNYSIRLVYDYRSFLTSALVERI